MKVRLGAVEGEASRFNLHALNEVIVTFDDGSADTCFLRELEVRIAGEWKSMRQAFEDRDLITDNENTCFFEPRTPEDRARGYTLDA